MDSPVRAFVSSVGGGEMPEDAVLPALSRTLEAAQGAHPGIVLDPAVFARYLGERVGSGCPMEVALGRLRTADLFLACACLQGDGVAIEELERDFLAPAVTALRKAGKPAADVEEAAQELVERLLVVDCKLREYSGRGALAGWIRISLARQHATLRRTQRRTRPLKDEDALSVASVDPDLALLRRRYAGTFQAAVEEAFRRLSAEQRTLLRLHFIDRLNIDRIAPLIGVSRATVGRRMLEAKRALLETVVDRIGERIDATPSEVASLITVLRSTLYGSVGALLSEAGAAPRESGTRIAAPQSEPGHGPH